MRQIVAALMNNIEITNIKNFKLLFILRNCAIFLGLIIVLPTQLFSNFDLELTYHLGFFAVLAVANIYAFYLLKNEKVSHWHFFGFLLLDILSFAGHIYYSGGIYNPFIGFFILPIILAVLTLPNILGLALISISITCYALLYFFYTPFSFKTASPPDIFFKLHVLGMLISFIIVAVTSALFVYLLVKNLRRKEHLIAQNNNLKALGLFAANAAHQLGTPLNSMQLISEEITDGVDIKNNSELLNDQIERAKNIIQDILEQSGKERKSSLRKQDLISYFKTITEEWQQYFPNCKVTVKSKGLNNKQIIADQNLALAFYNILDNSANAEANSIEMEISLENNFLKITVSDDGTGFKNNQEKGYGLYLTDLAIENLQGSLSIENKKPAIIMIKIPSKNILA